jgi:hypothetical protein
LSKTSYQIGFVSDQFDTVAVPQRAHSLQVPIYNADGIPVSASRKSPVAYRRHTRKTFGEEPYKTAIDGKITGECHEIEGERGACRI